MQDADLIKMQMLNFIEIIEKMQTSLSLFIRWRFLLLVYIPTSINFSLPVKPWRKKHEKKSKHTSKSRGVMQPLLTGFF